MLEIRFFGALRMAWNGEALSLTGLPKTGPLLAYLLLNRLHVVDREQLAYTLWPDVSESTAKANLRRHLYDLQNALPPPPPTTPWILRTSRTVQWNPHAPYWLDLARFESLDETPEHLAAAVALYTADLLAYLDEEWLVYERGRLQALYLDKVQSLVAHHTARGDYAKALTFVEQILRADPLHEEAFRESLKLRTYLGDRAGALQAYQHFCHLLQEELDLPPLPETAQLAAQIAADSLSSPSLAQSRPPKAVERPPQSAENPPSNVPAPVRPLVGREQEVAHLLDLLSGNEAGPRLITLTGVGGIGKTRLALEVAYCLRQRTPALFPDGIYFVPLATLTGVEQLLPAIASSLELPPAEDAAHLNELIEALRYRKILLVLDNFEHLLGAAPALAEFLRAAPGLFLLVTSQSLLSLYGEQSYPVKPLAAPDRSDWLEKSQLAALPAVALFCQAAQTADAHFRLTAENAQAIAHICNRLEGLPLALELAAARTRLLSPQAILTQLTDRLSFLARRDEDVPLRHRSLAAAMEWSYNLLNGSEQKLFQRLTLFADGFSPEAVAGVIYGRMPIGEGQLDWEVMEQLSRLLDKNMIRRAEFSLVSGESRFSMLTTLREFGLEKLCQDPEIESLHNRYVEFFAAALEARTPARSMPLQEEQVRWFQVEEANIRVGLGWALHPDADQQRYAAGLRMILAADGCWTSLLRFSEAREWIDKALPRRGELSLESQTRLLDMAGHIYGLNGAEAEEIFALHEDALALARRLEEPLLLSKILDGYGRAANEAQNYALSSQLWGEAIAIARLHMPATARELANLLNNLSTCYKWTQRYDEAIACLEECLTILHEHRLTDRLLAAHTNLSTIARLGGNLALDAEHLRHCLALMPATPQQNQKIVFLSNAAERALVAEEYSMSAILHSAMQSICQQVNMAWPTYYQREFASYVTTTRQHLEPEQFTRLWNLGARLSLNQAIQRVADWLGMEEV